jgi:hypothetical protein
MVIDHGTEVRARMRDRMRDAERQRLAAHAGAGHARRGWSLAGRRLRQAAGFGLVRTGLWLLDARRA